MKKRRVATKVLTRKSATTRKTVAKARKPGANLKIKGLRRFL